MELEVGGFAQLQEMFCLKYNSLPDEFKGKDSGVQENRQ